MAIFHYSNYETLDEAIVAFGGYCRDHELKIGLSHIEELMSIADQVFINDFSTWHYTVKALFCTSKEEEEVFNKCYATFWGKRKHGYNHTIKKQSQSNVIKKANASLVMAGFKPNSEEEKKEEEAKSVTSASQIDILKATDFSRVSSMDSGILDEITEELIRQLNHRLKRKMKAEKQGRIDLRNTIRKNMSNGDLLLKLSRKNRRIDKYRVNLILDVSGSMDKYSFFLLKFIWSLKQQIKQVESFIFSTTLVRITNYFNQDQLDKVLLEMSLHAKNWSGGTKIGECLQEFNNKYAKKVLNGKSVTIILSDGLDTGETSLISQELDKIKMRTNKLVWLNPLKGSREYSPEAKGMKEALPYLDVFASAHNFNSLLELENILSHV